MFSQKKLQKYYLFHNNQNIYDIIFINNKKSSYICKLI